MSASVAGELRDLARKLQDVTSNHPALSVAGPIVTACCDHLCAVARVHEVNAILFASEAPVTSEGEP